MAQYLRTDYGDQIEMPPEVLEAGAEALEAWVADMRRKHANRWVVIPAELQERAKKEGRPELVLDFVADHVERHRLPPLELPPPAPVAAVGEPAPAGPVAPAEEE